MVEHQGDNRTAMEAVVQACLKQLVPLIVEYSHVQKAIEFIKSEAIRHLVEDKGMSPEEAGAVLDRSGRWVYAQRNGHGSAARREAEKARAGYALQMAVLEFFARRTPEPASVVECLETLDETWPDLDDRKVVNLIDAFCKLGYLERAAGGYRWVQHPERTLDSSRLAGRMERVMTTLPLSIALQLDYLKEETVKLKRLGGSFKRSLYDGLSTKLTKAVTRILYEAALESDRLDEEGVLENDMEVEGFLMLRQKP